MKKVFFYTVFGLSVFFYISNIHASNVQDINLATVKESPERAWINYIDFNDSALIVNISANNTINDTTFSGWLNIDPQTYIQIGNERYIMNDTKGIALAPNYTYYTHPNQTINFDLIFPRINVDGKIFSLIENDSSEWKFKEIELFSSSQYNSNCIYYAPHKIARMLNAYSDSLMKNGEFDEIIKQNSLVLDILNENDIVNTDVLKSTATFYLAGGYNNKNDNHMAIKYALDVIDLYKKNNWHKDIALAIMFGVLADAYFRESNYAKAVEYGERALSIKQFFYPNGSIDLALTYGKLSLYYEAIDEYDKAISCAENGLKLREKLSYTSLKDNIPVIVKLCRYYYVKQRYADALNLALRHLNDKTLEIDKQAYLLLCATCSYSYSSLGNEDKAKYYANIGYDIITRGNPEDSIHIHNFLLGLDITDKISTEEFLIKSLPKNELYFELMQNLAQDYAEISELDKAIYLQEQCILQRNKYEIRNSSKECEGIHRLSDYYFYSGRLDEYKKTKKHAYELADSIFGKFSYEYADLIRTDFLYWHKKEDYYNAFIELNKMLDIYKYLIIRDFSTFSYDDRELLWDSYNDWFNDIYLNSHLNALKSPGTDINKLNSLLYDNILFSKGFLLNSQIAHNAHDLYSETLNDWINYSDTTSSVLNNLLYGSYLDILNVLNQESMAIEFIQANNTGELLALCLLPNKEFPVLEVVCDLEKLQELTNNPESSIEDFNTLIWSKLFNYIKDKKNIYISADGLLNVLPIENYISVSSCYQLNARVFRLSSTRQLLKPHQIVSDNYLLVGGLEYGNRNNYSKRFKELPESSIEISQISKMLIDNKLKCTIVRGKDGTTNNVKHLLQNGYSVAHLSTHSFYWQDKSPTNNNVAKIVSLLDIGHHKTDHRLARSGIILSSQTQEEHCILTSYEIAALNLENLELVVLPSCKSGQGDITKDGIVGLQRAFKEAKAGSILMSLWDADDISARLLMVEFYRNLLKGNSKQQSLKLAQQFIRDYTDEKGNKLFDSPYYWAGFILLDALD